MALNPDVGGASREPDRDPALDRVYALGPRDEPPARLDDAIRAAARREVHAGPRSLRARLRSWRMPVSIAAILVLSASLVTLMKDEGADRVYEGPEAEPPRTEQLYEPPAPRAAPAEPAVAPQAAARPSDRAKRDEPAPGRRNDMARQVESVLERVQPSAIPPARPAEERAAASPPGPAAREAERDIREAPGMADRGAPFAAAPPAKPAPAASGEALARKTDPGTAAQESVAQGADADVRARRELRSAPAAQPGLGAAASATRAPIWAGFERQPPEKWVERIEELRRAGREAEAREMQEEFRKRFPDHPLPASQ